MSVTALPTKMIPWQDRDRIGGTKAFFMTIFEALFSPADYFEKLQVRDDYYEPLILNFYNSAYLAGPLIPQMLFAVPFLAVIFIILSVPALLLAIAFLFKKILLWSGTETDFKGTVYVLAFSSPTFVLAYVPGVGFWFAAVAFTILAGIGLTTVHKLDFSKIILPLIFVPMIVMIPYGTVRYAKEWQVNHPPVDIEFEAQKVLAALSVAAENYALRHGGQFPADSMSLVSGPEKFLVEDYCGETINNYIISCDFRSFGYYARAQPQGWKGRGKKTFSVSTGGKLREEKMSTF